MIITRNDRRQVDFATKPQFWRTLHPPIKEKLGELLVIVFIIIIIIKIMMMMMMIIIIMIIKIMIVIIIKIMIIMVAIVIIKLIIMKVSLSYHPSSNTLTIAVLKVINLTDSRFWWFLFFISITRDSQNV